MMITYIFLVILGVSAHYLKKLVEVRKIDTEFSIKDHIQSTWPQLLLTAVSVTGAFVIVDSMGMMNEATAFFIGMAGKSSGDMAKKKAGL